MSLPDGGVSLCGFANVDLSAPLPQAHNEKQSPNKITHPQSIIDALHLEKESWLEEKTRLDDCNKQAAQRLREERALKKQAREEQLYLAHRLQEAEQEVCTLQKALRGKERDLKLAAQDCERADQALAKHNCYYYWRCKVAEEQVEALKSDWKDPEDHHAYDAYLIRDPKEPAGMYEVGTFVMPVYFNIWAGDFNTVRGRMKWRAVREKATKAMQLWYDKDVRKIRDEEFGEDVAQDTAVFDYDPEDVVLR